MKLNIGCGKDIREGYTNVDIYKRDGVDVVCDIENEVLPFKDNSVDEIICNDVLEHMHTWEKLYYVMSEFYRVLKPFDGVLHIEVPHYTSHNAHKPVHHLFFNCQSFDFFTCEYEGSITQGKPLLFRKERLYLDYRVMRNKFFFKPFAWFLEKLANIKPIFYEQVLSAFYPIDHINVTLRKIIIPKFTVTSYVKEKKESE